MRFASIAACLLVCLGCEDAPDPPGIGGGGPDGGMVDAATGLDGCAPTPEVCDGADNDCDGTADEDAAEVGAACDGPCGAGSRVCLDGALVCQGDRPAMAELCNGEDDDCDGTVDEEPEGVGEACATCPGEYECTGGALVCTGGTPEVCNGMDDDCDGMVDEAIAPQPCGEVEGACEAGTQTCADGRLGACIGAVGPSDETCDGRDEDCDGMVDEGLDGCETIGGPCQEDDDCPSGLCLDDDGSRYCSRECAVGGEDCGPAAVCVEVDGQAVCIPQFVPCETDCDCEDGLACMPARNLPDVERACRPERVGGLPVGAECNPAAAGECATGHCLARTRRCARLCCDQASCDAGTSCAEVFGVPEPVCVASCTADDDCPMRAPPPEGEMGPAQEVCRYRPDAEQTANIGICDRPNVDGTPVGGVCEGGQECLHGLCYTFADRDNYCTTGCVEDEDCPDGWSCYGSEGLMLNMLPIKLCRQADPMP